MVLFSIPLSAVNLLLKNLNSQIKGIARLPVSNYIPNIEIDMKAAPKAERRLNAIGKSFSNINNIKNTDNPFNESLTYLTNRLQTSFKREETMDGRAWAPLKRSTKQRKSRGGFLSRQKLQRTDKLRRSLDKGAGVFTGSLGPFGIGGQTDNALVIDPARVMGRKKVISAKVQQRGRIGDGATYIPRPFIGLAGKDRKQINTFFRKWAENQLKTGR